MTPTLLALAMLAQPECLIKRPQMVRIASLVLKVERHYGLPSSLLAAVVLTETGGRNVIAAGRGKQKMGCDVGIAQIHVPYCDQRLVNRYIDIEKNLKRSAYLLLLSKRKCTQRPNFPGCSVSIWGRYNPGSRRWARRLLDIHSRILNKINSSDQLVASSN